MHFTVYQSLVILHLATVYFSKTIVYQIVYLNTCGRGCTDSLLTIGFERSLNGFSPTDQISNRTIPKLQTSLAEVYLL